MSNAAFAAAAADAIDHSDNDNKKSSDSEEESDISTVAVSSNDSDEDSDDSDDDDDGDTEEAMFLRDARDIQNRTSRCVGTAAMEDCRFRSLFGARIEIVLKVWLMLGKIACAPRRASQSICSGRSIF